MQRLTSENEALMDISNALTAEKRQADERREAAAKQGKRINAAVISGSLVPHHEPLRRRSSFLAWISQDVSCLCALHAESC